MKCVNPGHLIKSALHIVLRPALGGIAKIKGNWDVPPLLRQFQGLLFELMSLPRKT